MKGSRNNIQPSISDLFLKLHSLGSFGTWDKDNSFGIR